MYILHCNDLLAPKWWLMWFNGIGRWRIFVLLLEIILVSTHWTSIVLIKNSNMSFIDLLSPAHYLYMDGILEVHSYTRVKSSLHLIWNLVWHLRRRRIVWHTILFISWTWRSTITCHIKRVNISLIWGVTKLSLYTHRLKIGWT